MKLIQLAQSNGKRIVGLLSGDKIFNLSSGKNRYNSTYELISASLNNGNDLNNFINDLSEKSKLLDFSYQDILNDKDDKRVPRLLMPIDHPDPYRTFISGTGLTHTGSVKSRDMMHNEGDKNKDQTDSAKMFQMGLEGGKPPQGKIGVAPEWFYKGNGHNLKGPNDVIELPDFSLDGGEEPEVVGCYFISKNKNPIRVGFTLGNEFSDHETEKINYLYLAHSKLRNCSIGPELDTELNFDDITLQCNVKRQGSIIYDSGNLKSGEEFMSHSLSNMEYHHFKYDIHRIPGDIHLHFFGTSQLSFSTRKWKYDSDDLITISSDQFRGFLSNKVIKTGNIEFSVLKA